VRRSAAIRVLVGFCVAAGCAKDGDPIRGTLDRMAKAAHDRNVSAVMDHVASDFQAADGRSRAEIESLLRQYFAAYAALEVELRNVQVERAENSARVRLRAVLSGQPARVGGLAGFLPTSAQYDFDFRMSRDGTAWRVAWASWQQAGD